MPTLKDLRAAAGLSQTELANASGVSLETIKKIETGKVERPHPATLRQLAAVLGQVPATLHSSRNGHVLDPGMVDNARRDQVAVLVIVPDPGRAVPAGFVPLRQTTLTGTLEGPLAALTLHQRFGYRRTECDKVLEARYRFPLPGDAAVTGVSVRFGEVLIETSLVPRQEAEAQFAAARRSGRQAALTARESPDVFTLLLTGLQPDQDVVVETTFLQLARPAGPGRELRTPLTIGPRYNRPDEAGSSAARGQPLLVWRDPGHHFSLDLLVRDAETVNSVTHSLALEAAFNGTQRVQLPEGSVLPDRDLVLSWQPRQAAEHPTLEVLVHENLAEGMRYFLALITPPATEPRRILDREITLLVDRSGSMAGPKWEACRWAVRRFLAGLRPSDTFNLGLFQSTCDWLAPQPLPATEQLRQRALTFLEEHTPGGGTELGPALEQALRAVRAPGDRARHVLLLTDAQVSDEGRILQLIEAEGNHVDRRSLSLICIDAAPRSAFVHELAEAGGGTAVFLSSDPAQDDITAALDQVLDTWAQPLARDGQLLVDSRAATFEARGARGRTRSTIRLGDLPAGRGLWVSGAMSVFSEPVFRLCAGDAVLAELSLPLEPAPPSRPAVRALFGAHQLLRLERLQAGRYDEAARGALLDALGYADDPLRIPDSAPLYAENVARLQVPVVQKLLVRESLRFGLVCSATAFVGVRSEAGRRIEAGVLVPSALPAGWSDDFMDQAPARARMASPLFAVPNSAVGAPVDHNDALRVRPSGSGAMRDRRRMPPSPAPVHPLSFHGIPVAEQGTALLVESQPDPQLAFHPTRLRASLEDGNPKVLDEGIELWVCVGQPHTPVVRVRLRELLTLGGERPLNLELSRGERLWVRLHLPGGTWPAEAGRLRVELV